MAREFGLTKLTADTAAWYDTDGNIVQLTMEEMKLMFTSVTSYDWQDTVYVTAEPEGRSGRYLNNCGYLRSTIFFDGCHRNNRGRPVTPFKVRKGITIKRDYYRKGTEVFKIVGTEGWRKDDEWLPEDYAILKSDYNIFEKMSKEIIDGA